MQKRIDNYKKAKPNRTHMQLNRGLVQLREAMLQKTIKQAKNRQEKKGYKAKKKMPKIWLRGG